MDEDQRNSQIEKIATRLVEATLSLEEQNQDTDDENSEGSDPIQKGDQFGAGFS